MKNPFEKLKGLTKLVDPKTIMMNMMENYLPQVKEMAAKINKPIADGGILEEGEEMARLMVDFDGEKPVASIITLKVKESNVLIGRVIPIENILPNSKENSNG